MKTVIEGAYINTGDSLLYAMIDLFIPENASVLSVGPDNQSRKYLLYGYQDLDHEGFHCIRDLDFIGKDDREIFNYLRSFRGGWPLNRFEKYIDSLFDFQRSFTTNDGKIFINAFYFHPKWDSYLSAVPKIMTDSKNLFDKKITESEINRNPRSIL